MEPSFWQYKWLKKTTPANSAVAELLVRPRPIYRHNTKQVLRRELIRCTVDRNLATHRVREYMKAVFAD